MPILLALLLAAPHELWSTPVKLEPQGQKTFHIKGLQKGQRYELLSRGTCERRERARVRRWRQGINPDPPTVFGVDFKVTIGGLAPISLDHEERRTSFTADRDDPELRIEDQSTPQAGVRCFITSLVIRVP